MISKTVLSRINSFLVLSGSFFASALAKPAYANTTNSEWGIEGMRSQEFSVGIFIFLIICIIVFVAIVLKYMRGDKANSLKTGEKIMFGMIFLGVLFAIFLGASQILFGNLL